MDQMQEMQNKLLSVVEMLRGFSEMIPRPENLITKTEKLFLTHMEKDDYYFKKIHN